MKSWSYSTNCHRWKSPRSSLTRSKATWRHRWPCSLTWTTVEFQRPIVSNPLSSLSPQAHLISPVRSRKTRLRIWVSLFSIITKLATANASTLRNPSLEAFTLWMSNAWKAESRFRSTKKYQTAVMTQTAHTTPKKSSHGTSATKDPWNSNSSRVRKFNEVSCWIRHLESRFLNNRSQMGLLTPVKSSSSLQ